MSSPPSSRACAGLRWSALNASGRKTWTLTTLVLRATPLVVAAMPETALRALPLLERALTLEPDYALAHGHAAFCYESLFVRAGRRDEHRQGAIRHAHAAIAYGRDDATALTLGGFNLGMIEHDRAAAREAFEAAIVLSPSSALDPWSFVACHGMFLGRLMPKPRGSRPSIAVLARAGDRKASDKVLRIQRSVLPSRAAMDSIVWRGSDVSSASHRWASRNPSIRIRRVLACIGCTAAECSPSPWMISRRRWGDVGVQGTTRTRSDKSPTIPSAS